MVKNRIRGFSQLGKGIKRNLFHGPSMRASSIGSDLDIAKQSRARWGTTHRLGFSLIRPGDLAS